MNYLKLLTCIFFLSVCSFGFSQSNVAHIDSQSLISQMPEVKEAQAQIEKLQKTYQTEIEASMKEYQTKAQSYGAATNPRPRGNSLIFFDFYGLCLH
jgi:outer membrane protein